MTHPQFGGLGDFPPIKFPSVSTSFKVRAAALAIFGIVGNLLFLAAAVGVVCLILNHFEVI